VRGPSVRCLADGGRDDILDLAVTPAAEYGLAVRVWLEPAHQAMQQRGLPVTDNDFLDSFSLDIEGKTARYVQMLRDLPAGLNEWAVHPGLGNEEAQAVDGGWPVRRTDYEFLTSSQARELLQRERHKLAGLATSLAAALRDRGVDELSAALAAESGAAVFGVAFTHGIREGETRPLDELTAVAIARLCALYGGRPLGA
jgi:hypothetical protein